MQFWEKVNQKSKTCLFVPKAACDSCHICPGTSWRVVMPSVCTSVSETSLFLVTTKWQEHLGQQSNCFAATTSSCKRRSCLRSPFKSLQFWLTFGVRTKIIQLLKQVKAKSTHFERYTLLRCQAELWCVMQHFKPHDHKDRNHKEHC